MVRTEEGLDSADWNQYRFEQQQRRAKRLPVRTQEIWDLRKQGYTVAMLTEYQFRINGRMDLYPIHNRWHDLRTQQRGGAKNLALFIKETFHHNE